MSICIFQDYKEVTEESPSYDDGDYGDDGNEE